MYTTGTAHVFPGTGYANRAVLNTTRKEGIRLLLLRLLLLRRLLRRRLLWRMRLRRRLLAWARLLWDRDRIAWARLQFEIEIKIEIEIAWARLQFEIEIKIEIEIAWARLQFESLGSGHVRLLCCTFRRELVRVLFDEDLHRRLHRLPQARRRLPVELRLDETHRRDPKVGILVPN
jgi:hypothetical protein